MTASPLQAVIMAGGEGSRLRPLTSNLPKPMLPVGNRPMMEHIVRLLARHGVTDVVATVQFLSSIIRNYFVDGSELGVAMSYATEEVPMGTAGSVLGARELLEGTFLVISGDALTDLDLTEVVMAHAARAAAATLVLKRMQDPLEFGIVMTNDNGRIERFLEKPTWGQVFSDTINTGIYVLEPEVLDLIPAGGAFDFSSELFPLMLDKGLPLYGHITDAYWADVGTTDAYLEAGRDVLDRSVAVDLPGFELQPGVCVGDGAEIDPDAQLVGPCLIGDNSRIGAGAVIGPYATLGANVIVAEGASVAHGVVMDRAHLAGTAHVRGGILGRGAALHKGATIEERSVVGDDVTVGQGALIKAGVKIYPSREVEAAAIVTQSVVRERRATRHLFGERGVAGLVNVGVTPQVAVRLGLAYGTSLPRGSVIVAGRDTSRAARTMKRAVIVGLNSAGVTCRDLELIPLPITRFTVRNGHAGGGISVRTSPGNLEEVEIRLFDSDGADLPAPLQRKIERIFFREEYRRPPTKGLGELEFPAHVVGQYSTGLLRALDLDAIRAGGLKVVVDYAFGPASLVGPSLVGRLGCDVLSVNAFTDEHRPVLVAEDLARLLAALASQVRASASNLGVLLEPGGDIAHLVDDKGRLVSHERALMLFLRHESARSHGGVAVPVSCPSLCERLALAGGASLQWTPTAAPALMARAAAPDVGFAGNDEGLLLFPAHMPAPDALMTFGKALEVVAQAKRPLSALLDELPSTHVARRDVRAPWERKGTVMREIASSAAPGRLLLLDGVKVIEDDRWALVIPYPDEPLCRIWAEAPSVSEAEALADHYARRVTAIVEDR